MPLAAALRALVFVAALFSLLAPAAESSAPDLSHRPCDWSCPLGPAADRCDRAYRRAELSEIWSSRFTPKTFPAPGATPAWPRWHARRADGYTILVVSTASWSIRACMRKSPMIPSKTFRRSPWSPPPPTSFRQSQLSRQIAQELVDLVKIIPANTALPSPPPARRRTRR